MKLAWVQIIVSLLIGALLGYGVMVWQCKKCGPCFPKAEDRKERILEKLSTKLTLTDEQKTKISLSIDKKHERMKELRNQTKVEIKSVLTEEQAKKFDELIAKCKGFN